MVKGHGERRVTGSQKLSCTIPLRTWERLERALDGGAADSRSAAVAEAIEAWVDRWELEEFQAQGGQISDRRVRRGVPVAAFAEDVEPMRGQVWWATIGGSSRPWLVVQAEALNETAPTVVALRLTLAEQEAGFPLTACVWTRASPAAEAGVDPGHRGAVTAT